MTMFNGLQVSFEKHVHDEDIEDLMGAIRQLKGVCEVEPIEASVTQDYFLLSRVKCKLWNKLSNVVDEVCSVLE